MSCYQSLQQTADRITPRRSFYSSRQPIYGKRGQEKGQGRIAAEGDEMRLKLHGSNLNLVYLHICSFHHEIKIFTITKTTNTKFLMITNGTTVQVTVIVSVVKQRELKATGFVLRGIISGASFEQQLCRISIIDEENVYSCDHLKKKAGAVKTHATNFKD